MQVAVYPSASKFESIGEGYNQQTTRAPLGQLRNHFVGQLPFLKQHQRIFWATPIPLQLVVGIIQNSTSSPMINVFLVRILVLCVTRKFDHLRQCHINSPAILDWLTGALSFPWNSHFDRIFCKNNHALLAAVCLPRKFVLQTAPRFTVDSPFSFKTPMNRSCTRSEIWSGHRLAIELRMFLASNEGRLGLAIVRHHKGCPAYDDERRSWLMVVSWLPPSLWRIVVFIETTGDHATQVFTMLTPALQVLSIRIGNCPWDDS